ncbi:hypothetical protein Bcep1808_7581 (plasmid) [Burkholderia vietnamiensis G4]|uniref:Uncharacterized protein n=1 Tax=Burkholderia vietnamiensis (strain G4 / LMG 22486) TaxID=269482 RepID=A4JW03_BURVG|nr:hypothetical protein Bcep1808_7581 [Burkholderia vietnamiensis G4]
MWGWFHLPRTLDDRGRLAPFPQGGKGGGMGGRPPTAAWSSSVPHSFAIHKSIRSRRGYRNIPVVGLWSSWVVGARSAWMMIFCCTKCGRCYAGTVRRSVTVKARSPSLFIECVWPRRGRASRQACLPRGEPVRRGLGTLARQSRATFWGMPGGRPRLRGRGGARSAERAGGGRLRPPRGGGLRLRYY